MRLTREEMETHIYLNELTDCVACVCTFSSKLKRKLKAAAEQFDDVVIKRETADGELVVELPKKMLSINVKVPKRRVMTEEQKRAFVERTRKAKADRS